MVMQVESPPSSLEEEEQDVIEPSLRPRRTKDDILNQENVREEKLRSKDVLDDVFNAVGVLCFLSLSFLNLFPPFDGEKFEFTNRILSRMHRRIRSIERVKRCYSLFISPFAFSIFKYRRLKRTPRMASIRSNSAFVRK
jgi:hypothetical protein